MEKVIITSVSQMNGLYYATFKVINGFASKMQSLFGANVLSTGKAYATLSAETRPELWVKGNVFSHTTLEPLDTFEQEMQARYNNDGEVVGNIAKPTCKLVMGDEAELVGTLSSTDTDKAEDTPEPKAETTEEPEVKSKSK